MHNLPYTDYPSLEAWRAACDAPTEWDFDGLSGPNALSEIYTPFLASPRNKEELAITGIDISTPESMSEGLKHHEECAMLDRLLGEEQKEQSLRDRLVTLGFIQGVCQTLLLDEDETVMLCYSSDFCFEVIEKVGRIVENGVEHFVYQSLVSPRLDIEKITESARHEGLVCLGKPQALVIRALFHDRWNYHRGWSQSAGHMFS